MWKYLKNIVQPIRSEHSQIFTIWGSYFANLWGEHIIEKCTQNEHLTIELFNLVHQPYISYTTPRGLGLQKIWKWLVYTISWCVCTLRIYEAKHARRQHRRGGVCVCSIFEQSAYTPGHYIHQPFSYFFKAQTRLWCIDMVSHHMHTTELQKSCVPWGI